METFNNPIPNGFEINHKDHNKNNNCLDNLEIITHSENCKLRSRFYKHLNYTQNI